jgi:hypothetical protein
MTIAEQLKAGEHIFSNIDELVKAAKFADAYEVIRNVNPPDEWVEEFTSLLDEGKKYKTIKIEVMEAVATRLFPNWAVSDISNPVINQSKDRLSVTLVGTIEYSFPGEVILRRLKGIATETAHNIALMPLITPKALAMAKKQAFKQLGNLFGLSLSRDLEGEAVNYAKIPDNALVLEAVQAINETKSLEELAKIQNLCAQEVQNDAKFTDAILQQKKILTLINKKDAGK